MLLSEAKRMEQEVKRLVYRRLPLSYAKKIADIMDMTIDERAVLYGFNQGATDENIKQSSGLTNKIKFKQVEKSVSEKTLCGIMRAIDIAYANLFPPK